MGYATKALGIGKPASAGFFLHILRIANVRFGSCVDGSLLARIILRFVQTGRVQSCVRPVDAALFMAAGPNAIRGIGSQS